MSYSVVVLLNRVHRFQRNHFHGKQSFRKASLNSLMHNLQTSILSEFENQSLRSCPASVWVVVKSLSTGWHTLFDDDCSVWRKTLLKKTASYLIQRFRDQLTMHRCKKLVRSWSVRLPDTHWIQMISYFLSEGSNVWRPSTNFSPMPSSVPM